MEIVCDILDKLDKKYFKLGVWFDIEDQIQAKLSKDEIASIINAAQAVVESRGYNTSDKKSLETIVKEVMKDKWGTGKTRKKRLEAAGYNYKQVRSAVNDTIDRLVDEVIADKWGEGTERERRLTEAGYNYQLIRESVNKRLSK